jgi:hypothetical protein
MHTIRAVLPLRFGTLLAGADRPSEQLVEATDIHTPRRDTQQSIALA